MADSKKYNGSTWEHSLRKLSTATDTITTLPADLYADGNNATVGLVGNMSQTGTPTPQNPIQPSECGERTAQLFEDIIVNCSIDATGRLIGNSAFDMYIAKVEQGVTYTASASITGGFYTTKPTIDSTSYNGQRMAFAAPTVTAPITGYMTFRVNSGSAVPMLNLGSTALPYEPYGIKIPISSANTTTPVYLGEVETTRKIKKYEFTGQEDWSISNNERVLYTALADHLTSNELICYCSHYKSIANVSAMSALSNSECSFNNTLRWFYIKDDNYNDATTFKTYLQQQYANGTPVTVWYVLATETTGIVNEPIRKIGDYADTVSDITIPTITGADSFDVETTLKPSEVELTYTGWHDAYVKEKSENLFDEVYQAHTGATVIYKPVYVGNGDFTLSSNIPKVTSPNVGQLFLLSGDVSSGATTGTNDVYSGLSRTVTSSNGYVTIGYRQYESTTPDVVNYTVMLNTGSTALPYEPYWK